MKGTMSDACKCKDYLGLGLLIIVAIFMVTTLSSCNPTELSLMKYNSTERLNDLKNKLTEVRHITVYIPPKNRFKFSNETSGDFQKNFGEHVASVLKNKGYEVKIINNTYFTSFPINDCDENPVKYVKEQIGKIKENKSAYDDMILVFGVCCSSRSQLHNWQQLGVQ